ncbi:MAG: RNA polymerase sigma factor [Oscillospiraceae bacterium]|jgi:RNA polymerase sigma-70 factor (ECF subfamily)|nr:RNA polymerase sigma factor [Oscillospiraceae bacterium]
MPQAILVRQAKEGSSLAFGELYQLYHKRLYAYACICLRSGALAEEAVQDAVLIAWRQLAALRNEASFEKWLFKILANRCRRVGLAESRIIPLGDTPIPDTAAPDTLTLSQETRDALDSLPYDEREIVLLCVLTGLSGKEAAAALGMNHGTLRSKRSRALAKIRKQLTIDS